MTLRATITISVGFNYVFLFLLLVQKCGKQAYFLQWGLNAGTWSKKIENELKIRL